MSPFLKKSRNVFRLLVLDFDVVLFCCHQTKTGCVSKLRDVGRATAARVENLEQGAKRTTFFCGHELNSNSLTEHSSRSTAIERQSTPNKNAKMYHFETKCCSLGELCRGGSPFQLTPTREPDTRIQKLVNTRELKYKSWQILERAQNFQLLHDEEDSSERSTWRRRRHLQKKTFLVSQQYQIITGKPQKR